MVNFYSGFVNCNSSRNATLQDVVGTVHLIVRTLKTITKRKNDVRNIYFMQRCNIRVEITYLRKRNVISHFFIYYTSEIFCILMSNQFRSSIVTFIV